MKLLNISTTDMGALGRRRLDLESLPKGLIGIVGENGTGKTSFLEMSCPGALYRRLPNRSPAKLVELAKSRSARVVAEYAHDGSRWRFVHQIDAQTRKGEAYIYRDGVPYSDGNITSNGKVKVFNQLVATILPSWDLVAMSRFWAQHAVGSWSTVPASASGKVDRRDILRELLGLDRFQLVANAAADQARIITPRLETLSAEMEVLKAKRAAIDEAETDYHAALSAARDLDKVQEQLEIERANVKAQITACRATANSAVAREKLERREMLEERREVLREEVATLRDRQDAARDALTDAQHAFNEAVAMTQAARDRSARYAAAVKRVEGVQAKLTAAMAKVSGTERPDLRAFEDAYRTKAANVREVEMERVREEDRLREIRNLTSRQGDDKVHARVLTTVPCGGEGEFSGCPLIQLATEARGRLFEYDAEIEAVREKLTGTDSDLVALERRELAQLVEDGRKARDLQRAWARVDELDTELLDAQVDLGSPPPAYDAAAVANADIVLRSATSTSAAAGASAARATQELTDLHQHLLLLPSAESLRAKIIPDDDWDGVALNELEDQLDILENKAAMTVTAQVKTQTEVRVIEARIATLREVVAGIDDLDRQLVDEAKRSNGYARIRHAFGPRGIQAVLVDAAGPTLSETATALLERAYDWARFRVDIRTTAEKKSGDGLRDIMEAVIYDAETDHEGPLENLSGGERDMVRAALSLAMAQHHSMTSGVNWLTAWADEAGAALTREKSVRWVSMLRAASDMLGVDQMLLVTHDEGVQEALDAVIPVETLAE